MSDIDNATTELTDKVKKIEITENSAISPRMSTKLENTHNNIFGEPPSSKKKTVKVYHMSSDIFGTGIIDREGQHVRPDNQEDEKDIVLESSLTAEATIKDEKLTEPEVPVALSVNEEKSPSREIGSNPLTGVGMKGVDGDIKVKKNQRRHFDQGRSQPLW